MEDSRLVGTPISTRHKLYKKDDSKEVDQTTYRSMIGILQHLVHTRPDIVVVVNCSNIVWFKQLLAGMKLEIKDLVAIFCDNTSAISISKNPMMHTKTKHIIIKYHFLRELVQDKEVRLEYVNTKEQSANIFTKPLPKDAFLYLRGKLGFIPLYEAH